jgi:hypothetical protein
MVLIEAPFSTQGAKSAKTTIINVILLTKILFHGLKKHYIASSTISALM